MSIDGPYIIKFGDVWHQTKREGRVIDEQHVCDGSQRLAIAAVGDIVMKRGSETSVAKWAEKSKESLIMQAESFGDNLQIINFPVTPETIELLNLSARNGLSFEVFIEKITKIAEAIS